ncbi:MAG TPA: hypothetical protein VGH98_23345 [Gemmatimonadaceae bacterium]|jgi:hypothetical protein
MEDVVRALEVALFQGFGNAEVLGALRKLIRDNWGRYVGQTLIVSLLFGESWWVTDDHLGGTSKWESVANCPAQPAGFDL